MGAPSKYKSEYCDMLIKHMAQGKSIATFGATIGVTKDTIYRWANDFPEFGDAKNEALQRSQEWFEQRLQAKLLGVKSKNFDPKLIDTTLLIFALKTRFHETYGDNANSGAGGTVNIIIDGKKSNVSHGSALDDKETDPVE